MQSARLIFARFKWLIICVLIAGLVGCGFHLRGNYQFAFSKIYINSSYNTGVSRELKRLMRRLPSLKLVNNPKEAQVILHLGKESQKRDKLTYDTQGRIREYRLRFFIEYSVKTPQGTILIDTTEFELERPLTYDDSDTLAKDHEELLLYEDMKKDAANQILRRLATLSVSPSNQTQLINPEIKKGGANFRPKTQRPLY